jgi:hypothetical protein
MFTRLFKRKHTKELRKWAEIEYKNDAEWALHFILEHGTTPNAGVAK